MRLIGEKPIVENRVAGINRWPVSEPHTQERPVFIFAIFMIVSGLLLFLVGFLAELIVSQTERLR